MTQNEICEFRKRREGGQVTNKELVLLMHHIVATWGIEIAIEKFNEIAGGD